MLVTIVAVAAWLRVERPPASGDRLRGKALLRGAPSEEPQAPRAPPAPERSAAVEDGSVDLEEVTPGAPHMLHGDARHTARAHGHLPRRVTVDWTFHADGPIEGQIVASMNEQTLYFTTLGGTLWALDLAGKPVFRTPLGGRAYGTPCIAPDGTIYVGSDGGAFFALDPAGRVKWRLETAGDADTSAVLTDDGLVVFAAGSRVYGVRGGVVAFRFQAKGKVFTSPALAHTRAGNARIVVGSQDDHVYALTTRGEVAWTVDLEHDVDGAATVGDDGAVYVGTDGDEVVRIDEDGRIAWRAPFGGPVRGTLSLARNGDVLSGVYGPSPRQVRVTPAGELIASFPARGNGTRDVGVHGGALEDDDGAIAFGAQDGRVRVVDRGGEERWAYDAKADVDAPLTLLADGSLLIGDYEGKVTMLRARAE